MARPQSGLTFDDLRRDYLVRRASRAFFRFSSSFARCSGESVRFGLFTFFAAAQRFFCAAAIRARPSGDNVRVRLRFDGKVEDARPFPSCRRMSAIRSSMPRRCDS